MSVWLVRAGRHGENEQTALDRNVVAIGWNELPDLSRITSRDELAALYRDRFPAASAGKASNHVGQIWTFLKKIKKGDLVVLPLKSQSAIAIGKVTSDYQFRQDLTESVHHVRSVEWIRTDLPRTAFPQDLLFSFGAFMTVCQIKRNNAEKRIQAILKTGRDIEPVVPIGNDSDNEESIDIEQAARDQILTFVKQRFAGHELARLVDAVLQAQGYLTRVSPPGPDGGVDILAGTGPMGFGSPRLCVQVKSSSSPVDVNVFRELQGILTSFHADQGLLVSAGGFKKSVLQEATKSFFAIRLWDAGDLLEAILRNYDKFSDELQAELPLKRIWTLVPDE